MYGVGLNIAASRYVNLGINFNRTRIGGEGFNQIPAGYYNNSNEVNMEMDLTISIPVNGRRKKK